MRPIPVTLLAALAVGFATPLVAQAAPVTVFVVRHAEKGPGSPDPDLTKAGTDRAEALIHVLGDANVTAIFASQFKRTQQTATPLAKKLGLTPEIVGAEQMDDLLAKLKGLPAGSRALVVSHSNLVPLIVEKLSGQKVGELTDADYDRIYAVTIPATGAASVLYLHFGAPNGSAGGTMRP